MRLEFFDSGTVHGRARSLGAVLYWLLVRGFLLLISLHNARAQTWQWGDTRMGEGYIRIPCTQDPNWNTSSYPFYEDNQNYPVDKQEKSKLLKYKLSFNVIRKVDQNGNLIKQYIGTWYKIENDRYPGEEFDVIVCGMLRFSPPNTSTGDGCPHKEYRIQRVEEGGECEYRCVLVREDYLPPSKMTSWHFGCKEIHIGKDGDPDESAWVYDGYTEVPNDMDCSPNHSEVKLSSDRDESGNVWKVMNFYVDIIGVSDDDEMTPDCHLHSSCVDGPPGANVELSTTGAGAGANGCRYANIWQSAIWGIKKVTDPDPAVAVNIEVGNWVTMSNPDNYPATMMGSFYGLRSGTGVMIVYPADAPGTDSTIDYDTATYVADTLLGCNASPVTVDIDFMITPYMDQLMTFRLVPPPGTCGANIAEGRVIDFLGKVCSRQSNTLYDSLEYMYGIRAGWVRDTTAPIIGSINTDVIDPSTLAIEVLTGENYTLIDGAWVQYQLLGDTVLYHDFLDYEDNLSVSDSTIFRDTLDIPVDSATVIFSVSVRNLLGLVSTSALDTCIVYGISSSVNDGSGRDLQDAEDVYYPNPSTGRLRIALDGEEHVPALTLQVYDNQGGVILERTIQADGSGGRGVEIDVSDLPAGVYWFVLEGLSQRRAGKVVIAR